MLQSDWLGYSYAISPPIVEAPKFLNDIDERAHNCIDNSVKWSAEECSNELITWILSSLAIIEFNIKVV